MKGIRTRIDGWLALVDDKLLVETFFKFPTVRRQSRM